MPGSTSTDRPAAAPAATFFARIHSDAAPASGTHSWVRRVPDGVTCDGVAARLSEGVRDRLLPTGLQLWTETTAGSGTARLRERELTRPLPAAGPHVRAVLIVEEGGPAELVLVATRHHFDRYALDMVGRVLLDGVQEPVPHETGQPRTAAPAPAAPAWGLGEPGHAGVPGVEPIGVAGSELDVPALLTAAVVTMHRYGDIQPRLALIDTDAEGRDRYTAISVPAADQPALADLARRAASFPQAGDGDPEPAVAMIVDQPLSADETRAFLAPPLPVTIHWSGNPGGGYTGTLAYDRGALSPAMARQFAGHLLRALHKHDGELLTAEERADVLAAGRPVSLEVPEQTIDAEFRRIAAAQPDAPAVSDASRTLTYRECDEAADRWAGWLREHGAGAGTRVGICLERTADLVIAMLAVLRTGAAYVPMDPQYPLERLRYTAADAGLQVVIGEAAALRELPEITVADPATLSRTAAAEPVDSGAPAAPAYVIYTSGSTGKPKGVVVPHRNVLALVAATAPGLKLGSDDVWTLFHSSAFDFSVWEIWGSLLTGGHLIVVPYWVSRSPEEFHALLADRGVTVLSQTPSAFASLRDVDRDSDTEVKLRLVVFGGEPLDTGALELWFRRHPHDRCRLINMFGITETTVHVTEQRITPVEVAAGSRSVGTALPGWSLSVRDPHGAVQPYGVPGEIYVGGAGLADGYLGRPELTAERFITDSVTGERVYRSGDLGRLRPDGRLDHLGRIDDQVKVRGFRIELGEIRAVLLEHPAVTSAVVVLHRGEGDAADVRLDAYVVLRSSGSVTEVRDWARSVLPAHMVPATITAVPEIALTVNGKADTSKLPVPELLPADRTPQPALDEPSAPVVEQPSAADLILKAWRATLGDQVSPDDDFFELGGNSLLAVRLSAALRREGLPPVPLRDLYLHPTAALLAKHLQEREPGGAEAGR